MRILQVCYIFPPQLNVADGITNVAYKVSHELVKRGHEVVVYTSNALNVHSNRRRLNKGMAITDGIFMYYLPYVLKRGTFIITPSIISLLKENLGKFDVIHIHSCMSFQGLLAFTFAKKVGVPYILQAHGSLPRKQQPISKSIYDVLFSYQMLKNASKVIALSYIEAQRYRNVGIPEEKIAVIPNGIDLSEYTNLPPKGFFKKKFNIPEHKKIILYLGRIHKTKGIDFLVKAYACLIKEQKYNEAVLVIAGPDDGFLSEVRSLANYLGVSDSVLFTGFIGSEDKLKALVDARVFVTPSFYGFPITFLEACVTGTPILTTMLGDRLEWIDGNVGYVTESTPSDLAMAIYTIISDNGLHKKFSKNCKRIVRSKFSLDRVVTKIEKVYKETVESKVP
jgi:glycosyltransferase involved in cell wall biosynthesis